MTIFEGIVVVWRDSLVLLFVEYFWWRGFCILTMMIAGELFSFLLFSLYLAFNCLFDSAFGTFGPTGLSHARVGWSHKAITEAAEFFTRRLLTMA